MVKQRNIGPDQMDENRDASSAFLDALRTGAMDDLLVAATEYGYVKRFIPHIPHILIYSPVALN